MAINHGRIGNEGFSYFSETAFKNLEKAIQLLEKYNSVQHKSSLEGAKAIQNEIALREKYKQQLENMGIDLHSNLDTLKRQYETEKEIYEQRQKERIREQRDSDEKKREQKRTKIMQQWEKDFQELINDNSDKEIANQKKLNEIREKAIKQAEDLRISEKKRQADMYKYAEEYRAELQRQNRQKNIDNFKSSVVGSIFGTTSQDVEAIKDGSFMWSNAIKVFSKAVEVFRDAIKDGIDKNYNTAQETLNRIVASNSNGGSFGWARGTINTSNIKGFVGGKSYTGYKQINNLITDQLSAEGLFNNISNTDVMKSVASLTSERGFGLEKAIAKGYQDTVIKYIVPYLDTASEAYDSLELLLPRNV